MKFEEAREKIRQTLEKYKSSISLDGIEIITDITYQNGNFEECGEDDKKLRLMSGEIFLRHKALSEEQALGFTMIVDCKHKNYISERDVLSEIEGFCASVDDLIAQLTAPVKWTQSVRNMVADGASEFVEVGPGKVLQGLVKKIARDVTAASAVVE